ncbi:uncharacterized protein LOC112094123 [Morus notabilis]|uniref:uncharacterized protein LOC112094123 n=1 Tax=Morus notabilis TaxID=981085 RepID=UPI000CED0407|nr:uncharacterized protein LOC112094123 [Morus notabilis]
MDVIKLDDPEFSGVPQEILVDCAIDDVHVPAIIRPEDQVPFIGRKRVPTQNGMAACDFNMKFTYAYAGWEGKYYLVDAGYPQLKGFLGPYRGERYHLEQFRMGRRPTGYKEDMPNYAFAKQVKIVIATMALHNYIRKHRKRDLHFQRVENNLDDFVYEENQPDDSNVEEMKLYYHWKWMKYEIKLQ